MRASIGRVKIGVHLKIRQDLIVLILFALIFSRFALVLISFLHLRKGLTGYVQCSLLMSGEESISINLAILHVRPDWHTTRDYSYWHAHCRKHGHMMTEEVAAP